MTAAQQRDRFRRRLPPRRFRHLRQPVLLVPSHRSPRPAYLPTRGEPPSWFSPSSGGRTCGSRWTPLAFLAGKVVMVQGPDGARSSPPDVRSIICSQAAFFTHGTYWESEKPLDSVCSLASHEPGSEGPWRLVGQLPSQPGVSGRHEAALFCKTAPNRRLEGPHD